MDPDQRRKLTQFWFKLLLSLTLVGLGYMFIIRPAQSFLVRVYIVPTFSIIIKPVSEIMIQPGNDDFFIISTVNAFVRVKIDVPFSGYFWLAMAMILPSRNKRTGKIILYYSFALFGIIPVLTIALLEGHVWLAPIVKIHEIVYNAIFLSLGMLAVREGALKLDKHASKKL